MRARLTNKREEFNQGVAIIIATSATINKDNRCQKIELKRKLPNIIDFSLRIEYILLWEIRPNSVMIANLLYHG